MSVSIRPVDPWDEDELVVLQALYVEAQRAEVPDARVYSRADSVLSLTRRLWMAAWSTLHAGT